jgi:putative DNA-invertase from lambdoid prophage Rac
MPLRQSEDKTQGESMKVAIYARVSRDDLHCENQKQILDTWVMRNKPDIESYEYFTEEQTTRKTRPIKESIIKAFREGKFDTIVVARIDRFARSTVELVQDIESIINQGGRFVSIGNNFDFQKKGYNASQQLQLNIFAAFAQFERELIRERTYEGLARSKAQGKIGGRHPANCGCGKQFEDGRMHNGWIKPIRGENNQITGWRNEKNGNKSERGGLSEAASQNA